MRRPTAQNGGDRLGRAAGRLGPEEKPEVSVEPVVRWRATGRTVGGRVLPGACRGSPDRRKPGCAAVRRLAGELGARLSANWASIRLLTSFMTPPPNWAALPVTFRSVTHVDVGDAVVLAQGGGHDGLGAPVALGVAALGLDDRGLLSSSFSTNAPWPLKVIAIGPSLIFIPPSKASPSTEVTAAPGRQGAIFSTSVEQLPTPGRRGRAR